MDSPGMARILDGKALAARLRGTLGERVRTRTAAGFRPPGLAVVLVGQDPASATYVRNKRKACAEIGVLDLGRDLPAGTSQAELLALIGELNADPRVDGILVQLPLPDHLDAPTILRAIAPDKDADGFHPLNAGKLLLGEPAPAACTPTGVMALIAEAGIDPAGKHAVVIGRSNIVGKPAALMLLASNATVSICHSRTADLPALVRQADIVVAAVGRPGMVRGDWLKPGAVVIDVGTNRLPDGRLVGDVAFEEAARVAGAITPVPGGVGPMTIAMLMRNTIEAWERSLAT